MEPSHHELSPSAYSLARGPIWAKCDMLGCVALSRLSVVLDKGARIDCQIPQDDLAAIMEGVKAALGIG
jgi:uncharacterized protein YifN (PemK superfamily)